VDPLTGAVHETAVQRVLRELRRWLDIANGRAASLAAHQESLARLLGDVRRRGHPVAVSFVDLLGILALHDAQVNVLRLCVTVASHVLQPEQGVVMPPLEPISPVARWAAEVEAETASPQEVEAWLTDPFLRRFMTGTLQQASQAEILAAVERFPRLFAQPIAEARRRAADVLEQARRGEISREDVLRELGLEREAADSQSGPDGGGPR